MPNRYAPGPSSFKTIHEPTVTVLGACDRTLLTDTSELGNACRVQFTVNDTVTVDTLEVFTVETYLAPEPGGVVGIASDFTGTSTVPWLGQSAIAASPPYGWIAQTLDTPVTLVPGVTYCVVSTKRNVAACQQSNLALSGVIATLGNLRYGTSYDGAALSAYGFPFRLDGTTSGGTDFTGPSTTTTVIATLTAAGAVAGAGSGPVPRRLPPTPEERLQVVISRLMPGSNGGSTAFVRRSVATNPAAVRGVTNDG